MWATERLLEIEQRFGPDIERIIPLELDGQTLRLILYLQEVMQMIMIQDILDPAAYLGDGWFSAFLRGFIPREGLLDGLQLCFGFV